MLCEYCVKIPLDPWALRALPEYETSWSLGSGSRVKESSCPLCKLVKSIFFADQKYGGNDWTTQSLADAPEVVLDWYNDGGQSRRGAFTVESVNQHYLCFGSGGEAAVKAASTKIAAFNVDDAFYLRPGIRPRISIDAIRGLWLSTCMYSHGPDCEAPEALSFRHAFPGLKIIRFIDVMDECLVEGRDFRIYVALSYVWGAVQNFRLTKVNKKTLSQKGAFRDIQARLPRTVQDAMVLVRELGYRYLWVDALCLLQNDHEDLEAGITVMDEIYERSCFTIVAACGHDANAGLPGVREGSREQSSLVVEVKPGVPMGVETDWELLFESSVYSTRAWTLQEFLLSKRTLSFVNDRVYFHCTLTENSETCDVHPRPTVIDSSTSSQLMHSVRMALPMEDFANILLHYTQRVLGDQNDVLRALAGIIRRFSDRLDYPFLQGLPTGALDIFVLFRANRTVLHRRPSFPSYSWAGWAGGVMVDGAVESPDVNEWLKSKTWIIWYQRSPSGVTELVWDKGKYPGLINLGNKYIGYWDRNPFEPPRGCQVPNNTAPADNFDAVLGARPYPLLQFWTLAVFFHLDHGTMDVFLASADITRDEGVGCGRVWMDGFEEMPFFESRGPYEFILLSERGATSYNVMMLEWIDGVAERRGIGYIYKASITRSSTFNTQYVSNPHSLPLTTILSAALASGLTAFDTSPYYGPSETLLGTALSQLPNHPRSSYLLITKAGRIAPTTFDYSPTWIRYSVLRSLQRLHTSHLDLVYTHDCEFVSPSEVLAAVRELRKLRGEGLIKYVGISGFPVEVLANLAEMILSETGEPLDAVLSYGHFTLQNARLGGTLERLKKAGVDVVLNASILGMGLLTSRGIPVDEATEGESPLAKWHPSPPALRVACKEAAGVAGQVGERLESVAIRWAMEEWARVGKDVGVQVEGVGKVGGTVCGITRVEELEETVREWRGVLDGLKAEKTSNKDGDFVSERQEKVIRLAREKIWPALGEWKDYVWASPGEGFVNERKPEEMGVVPDDGIVAAYEQHKDAS
ncbi:hypothetical protein OQA88_7509 [Cercophora sp. LCS_1]